MLTGSTTGISTFKGEERALRADRMGTPSLLFSVIAASAPLMVVAGVMPNGYGVMGIVGQPLVFVLLGVVLALFSVGYAEMSRHVHNAGAFYAYIARGLGGTAGTGASIVALVAYAPLQYGVYGLFGFEISSQLSEHANVTVAWWIPALGGVVLIGLLGWLKIDLNAKVLGVLLVIEITMVVIFDISGILDPSKEGLSLHAFNPGTLSGAGLGSALALCLAGFVGFEQSPVYAEETSRPQILVARVTFLAIGFISLFYALGSWVLTVATGPSHIVGESAKQGSNLLFTLAQDRLGTGFTDVLHLFFVTGMFACLLSFHNVVARYAFAMGREGLLPSAFGRTNRTTGAPAFGSLLQTVISLAAVAVFAITDGKPAGDPTAPVLRLFVWSGNIGALGIMVLLATTSIAVIVFFVRRGAARAQAWRIAASAVACAGLAVIIVYTVRDFDVLLGSEAGSPLTWILPGIVGAAAVGGLAYGLVLRSVNPQRHARIGLGNEAVQISKARASGGPGAPDSAAT
ncbi:APC family permease [Actinacidiphila oryziradicis]|uniref:APC family permease n=1 Tax=Actinacidiphila oryziradicis TaxID=2571141 RepID=UPI0023F3846F|nr:APC family permease [Actinacidiphila oryziradicis]MCW2869179.1 amino acid permease-associated region [Actinacidiphila oryziradicis]